MTPDILIVGGGIAGVSAAARLSKLGAVTLLEAEDALGYHTSGRSAAMFEENYGNSAIKALSRASGDYLRHAHGGVLSPRGFMLVAAASDQAQFEADMSALRVTRMTKGEALAMVPILNPETLGYAGFDADAQDVDTDLLIQNFARDARKNGASILTGAGVRSISRTKSGYAVITARGTFRAPLLINAAGAWADQIATMAGVAPLGLHPCRRSMARIPAPGGHDVSGWPMLLGAGEAWYAKPDAGKLLISPAEETRVEPHDAWADDMTVAEGIARYEQMVSEPVTRVETTWAGLRTFAPDRTLVIGRDDNQPGFFWLAGQGGYGFQTAPAASALAAELIGGMKPTLPPDMVDALSPARFL